MQSNSRPLICLAGPTASGKTNLSFFLAEKLNSEIISVDSALVFKGMDIGTAKPTIEERQKIKHHLIDILDVTESYSVARFIDDVKDIVKLTVADDNSPILVGGTMLYFKGLIDGISGLPAKDEELRKQINNELKLEGLNSLYQKLYEFDPISAARISPNDSQRIQRAIEVIRLTGKKLSVLQENKFPIDRGINFIALVPSDRTWLHNRIKLRFFEMLELGFLKEVEALVNQYNIVDANLPSVRCVGYRQAYEYLRGDYSYAEFIDRSLAATRQLAKRQLTWLRNWKGQIKYFDPLSRNVNFEVLEYIYSLNNNTY